MAQSSAELIERLAKAPPRTKALVFAGAALFLGLVYWYFFYSDLSAQKSNIEGDLKRKSQELTTLQQRKKEYDQLVEEKTRVQEMIKKNTQKFPAKAEVSGFLVYMDAQATAAGVTKVKLDRLEERPVETYMRVPMDVEIAGRFYDIIQFFKLLRDMDRIITIENLWIGNLRVEAGREILTAKFRASIFRQPDAPPPGAPGALPAPGGNK
jgi:type IV pilus assembly protein PilO